MDYSAVNEQSIILWHPVVIPALADANQQQELQEIREQIDGHHKTEKLLRNQRQAQVREQPPRWRA